MLLICYVGSLIVGHPVLYSVKFHFAIKPKKHLQKPYACQIEGCNKRYTDPSSLRKHIKNHTLGSQKHKILRKTVRSILQISYNRYFSFQFITWFLNFSELHEYFFNGEKASQSECSSKEDVQRRYLTTLLNLLSTKFLLGTTISLLFHR